MEKKKKVEKKTEFAQESNRARTSAIMGQGSAVRVESRTEIGDRQRALDDAFNVSGGTAALMLTHCHWEPAAGQCRSVLAKLVRTIIIL